MTCFRFPSSRAAVLAALASLAVAGGVPAADGGALRIDPVETPVELYQFGIVTGQFTVHNDGEAPVRIVSVKPRRGRGDGSAEPEVVPPGGSAVVSVRRAVEYHLGLIRYGFVIATDETDRPTYIARLPTFVQSAYQPETQSVDFGPVTAGTRPEVEFEVTSTDVEALRVVELKSAPDWLDVEWDPALDADDPQRVRLRARLKDAAPRGTLFGYIHLRTDFAAQPDLVVAVEGTVFGEHLAEPFPLMFGGLHENTAKTIALKVWRRDGQAPELAKAVSSDPAVTVEAGECADDCLGLDVTLQAGAPRSFRGRIVLEFTGSEETLDVPFDAMIVSEGTALEDLGVLDRDVEFDDVLLPVSDQDAQREDDR
jgi:hypothetical protein